MPGFVNLGNTCFFNSTLQLLLNLAPFRDYFTSGKYKEDYNEADSAEIFQEWLRIVGAYSGTAALNPLNFLKAVAKKRPAYQAATQKDASECLADLFEFLHKALRYNITVSVEGTALTELDQQMINSLTAWKASVGRDYSIITALFYGQHLSRMTCGSCGREEVRYDTFFATPLPIMHSVHPIKTLSEALDAFCRPETISDQWKCDACNKVAALRKQLTFWKMPPILILTLQRFDNTNNKIGHYIDYPLALDMRKWTGGYDRDNCQYTLQNVIVHGGGTNGGHYVNLAKVEGSWQVFDDQATHAVNDYRTPGAYILTYVRN